MKTPALVVIGDEDVSPHLAVRDADWQADPYFHSPGPKSLLTLYGGKHGLGDISGYDVAETTDESPISAFSRQPWRLLDLPPGHC